MPRWRTWQATPSERARDLDLLAQQLRRLADYAGDNGVTLCIEPLNRFETSFLNLAEQGVELIDRVNHPACQLMLDTFHMNIEEKALGRSHPSGRAAPEALSCLRKRPWDARLRPYPLQAVAEALHTIHYNGPVVIESFTDKVKTIARAAAIWRPLAPSQDALAKDGLSFLKTLLTD